MEKLAEILGIPKEKLEELERAMAEKGFEPALEKVEKENEELIRKTLVELGLGEDAAAEEVRNALTKKAEEGDNQLYEFLEIDRNNIDFQKVANAARGIATENEGFFLKKEYGEQILRERKPEALLDYLGYKDIEELLAKEDITEIFSALRFTETDAWMHKTFEVAYTKFTPKDFERRPIELKVLGPQWEEVAKKYVAKKHHNVSHLKEFGVIFLNPIAQSGAGKFVRDFALLLHYFHEIAFYSKLFQRYAKLPDFNQKFISLLRGDVPEATQAIGNTWLIIQRYLWKENPKDPRLFVPHVNPEAMHWRKAEQDLVKFGEQHEEIDLEFWNKLWSVAGFFSKELVSFDLEDNAMMLAHRAEGKAIALSYHQQEALWNRLFASYVGGPDKLEEYFVRNMDKGVVSF
ncbi:MAG TPA: hypothetical protein VJC15_03495 [Candidatus Paceibacterota bacterium]